MPLDEALPPSQLSAGMQRGDIAEHFKHSFGVVVDPSALPALPGIERLSLTGARLPEPSEALLLDRVLQVVPAALLAPVEAIVILADRGTGRQGGARDGIVRVSAQEARLREGDPAYGHAFSLFTTTMLHEIGHVVFERRLSGEQQERLSDMYLGHLASQTHLPVSESTLAGLEHFFISLFIPGVLGRGQPPITAGVARRTLSVLGIDWRHSGG